ncbi:hypothetical protein E2C01_092845 [Portunus trituberculatus]|uniref:Uncharacterized protein n=1 Tax=Portunus trituberculatus TaxID=210409 RepID=A0A5B7JWI7_PORTR|nr:hypothetical protein [Portunus trituberculatus]
MQALSHKTTWQGQDLLVSYLLEFIVKTDMADHSTPREFRIKSLATVVGSEDVERLLCLVRAVRHYLQRTALPTRPCNLFLAVKCPSRPMSKAAISFFLWDTIKSAHASFPDSSCRELKVRAHDICGIATCMFMWKNCSVPTIFRAACWRTLLKMWLTNSFTWPCTALGSPLRVVLLGGFFVSSWHLQPGGRESVAGMERSSQLTPPVMGICTLL